MNKLERPEQITLKQYLDARNLFWFHASPNAYRAALARLGERSKTAAAIAGKQAQQEGVKAGVADNLILEHWALPVPTSHAIINSWREYNGNANRGFGVVVELKAAREGAPSPEQKAFLHDAQSRGMLAFWCHGAMAAIDVLQHLHWLRPKEKDQWPR